ncbi:5188_t:CDS:1, partial [Funneliformis mosseae]
MLKVRPNTFVQVFQGPEIVLVKLRTTIEIMPSVKSKRGVIFKERMYDSEIGDTYPSFM